MFLEAVKNLFDGNAREVAKLEKKIREINSLEAELEKLSHSEILAKTQEFKEALRSFSTSAEGRENQMTIEKALDDILPQAFALVREASRRTIGLRHFDVQLIGGIVLHQGRISEMKTGEGKTLVATLALYLNALLGRGAHLVTVNDYLAKRDAVWMGPI